MFKWYLLGVGFMAFVLLSNSVSHAQLSKAQAELKGYELLEKGRRLSRTWQFAEAVPVYEQVAKLYPKTDAASEAHWYIGNYNAQAHKRLRTAIKHYDIAIKIASEECEFGDYARLDRARAYYLLGEYEIALKQFESILKESANEEVTKPSAAYSALCQMKMGARKKGDVPTVRLNEDALCGPRSLQALASANGKSITLKAIQSKVKSSGKGVTLQQLLSGAKSIGLPAYAVRLTIDDLKRAPMPAVLWVLESHFTVVKSVKNNLVTLQEPGKAAQTIHLRDLATFWGGEALIVTRSTPRFKQISAQEMKLVWGGSHLGNPGPPGPGGPDDPENDPPGDDPVNMTNGNQFLNPPPDLIWNNTIGTPVIVRRWFNAQLSYNGNYGAGWTNNLDINLRLDASQNATVMRANGRMDTFTWTGSNFIPPRAVDDTLIRNGDNTHTLIEKRTLNRYLFNEFGRLAQVTDRNGNQLTMTYQQIGQPGDPGFRLLLTRVRDASGQDTVFTYNASNLCERITDPSGRFVQYTYNAAGRLTVVTLPDGSIYRYTYGPFIISRIETPFGAWNMTSGSRTELLYTIADPQGRTTTHTYQTPQGYGQYVDARGNTWRMHFNANGSHTGTTNPLGKRSTYVYDAQSRMIRAVDENGFAQQFGYDASGNVTSFVDANGKQWTYQYNSNNNLTLARDPLGRETRWVYDANQNMTQFIEPNGATWVYTYDSRGLLLTARDPLGNLTTFGPYNAFGKPLEMRLPNGSIVRYTYDERGNVATRTDANDRVSLSQYDSMNRLTQITYPDGTTQRYAYNCCRYGTTYDEYDRATTYQYDGLGNVTSITDPKGGITRYEYDEVYNLRRITDPNNNVTLYTYNAANRLTQMTIANGTAAAITEQYQYDHTGRLTGRINGNGTLIKYNYDPGGNLLSVTSPDYFATFNYDAVGNIIRMSDPVGKHTLRYDANNRVVSYTDPFNESVRYTYDLMGNRKTITTRLGVARYYYDVNNRLARINTPLGNYVYRYDPAGDLIEVTGPAHRTLYTYDARGRVTSVRNLLTNGTLISSHEYTLDVAGNPVRLTEFNGTDILRTNFIYDELQRLIQEVRTGGAEPYAYRYSYDAAGNRLTMTDLATDQTTNYTYNAANQLLTEGNVSYAYDGNGNMISRTAPSGITRYFWNGIDKLTRVELAGGGAVNYGYNAQGKRATRTGTGGNVNYLIDPVLEAATVLIAAGSGNPIHYYPSPDGLAVSEMQGATGRSYLFNRLGSVSAIINNAGTVTARGDYDAWGKGIGASAPGARGYVAEYGYWTDPQSSLALLNDRWYDPQVGRFISRDPIGTEGGLNLYAYADASPTRLIDPLGQAPGLACVNTCAAAHRTDIALAETPDQKRKAECEREKCILKCQGQVDRVPRPTYGPPGLFYGARQICRFLTGSGWCIPKDPPPGPPGGPGGPCDDGKEE
ncbi:MAG: hypothetical protein KIT45_03845 [Fimbriimonadia bacterium]|nr:hypothetical protein [Fimbriimonadia bacterium]